MMAVVWGAISHLKAVKDYAELRAAIDEVQVEDIVDIGNTLSSLIDYLKSKGASSISVCTLLDKPSRQMVHFELVGKGKYYCGLEELAKLRSASWDPAVQDFGIHWNKYFL